MKTNQASKGFTLIEVLIAMTLLSIMMVLLFTSLKICADSWEKGESKITDVNEIAVVYNFFQRDLSVAKPLWNDLPAEEEKTFSFQGGTQSLQFVSAFPASAGRSGLQLFSLNLLEEDNERVINVTIVPFIPMTEGAKWHKEEVTLIKHVSDFTLAYFGSADGVSEGTWTEEWLNKEVLPRLVKINIKLENGSYWPEMIIDLKVTGTTDNAGLGTGNTADINQPEAFQ
ncbi:MAG: prepilin-type N-terminal cleavage/methylation domain-containing protein [Methylococcaceae bacterium]|nr:prepilin-type N-terminal cleavage/methylation domain-containing protein [Methylococcaceae bacterium]